MNRSVVPRQDEVRRARRVERVVLPAAGVDDGNDEIRAFAAQHIGFALNRVDNRSEFQVA